MELRSELLGASGAGVTILNYPLSVGGLEMGFLFVVSTNGD